MAIAAGIPPPRVMLLDANAANAAAIGSSPDDATVVVSRRLLDEFNRDETQGVLGHLIASISNGDLRITLATLSLLQTFGLLMTMLDVPLSGRAREGLGRLLRFIVWRRRDVDPVVEADWVRAILTRSLSPDSIEDISGVIEDTDRPSIGWLHRALLYARMFLLLPFLLASLLAKLYLFLFTLLVLGPTIWTTLRARRYLADATAVQLTRSPDGLASALIALEESRGVIRGAEWASHLFVAGVNRRRRGSRAGSKVGVGWIRSQPKVPSRTEGSPAPSPPAAEGKSERRSIAEEPFLLIGAHPPLHARLKRLHALGASIQAAEDPSVSSKEIRGKVGSVDLLKVALAILIVGPILILFAWFFLYLLAVAVMASAFLFGGLILLIMRLLPHLLPP
jgi:Zn-dependent protease with chaperone function